MDLDDRLDEDNPYRSPAGARGEEPASAGPAEVGEGAAEGGRYVMEPLTRASGWITFAGVLMIIYGAMSVLMLIGIPFLWVGILLVQSQSRIKQGHASGDLARMREGSDMLRQAAKIWGITTIVGLGLMILIYGTMIVVIIAGAASGEFR